MADNTIEKEKLVGQVERARVVEELPTVESPRKQESVEVMSWMEKLERRFGRTPQQSASDVQDDTTPAKPARQQPPVTVPVTATQMQIGSKLSPDFALSWLVVWAKRKIQQLMRQNRKVLFAPEPVEPKKEK